MRCSIRLQNFTEPRFTVNRSSARMCGSIYGSGGSGGTATPIPAATGDGGAAEAGAAPEVTVVAAGSIAPYDYEILSVNPASPDLTAVAARWLAANGYATSEPALESLRPYLRDGMNLVAFKLRKGSTTAAIRPIMLSYQSDRLTIPLRATAPSARDDMGLLVWVLGPHRAVPANYRSLELNEAVLDWFNVASSYDQVVTAAADEAGGQGFVTENARSTTGPFVGYFLDHDERQALETYRRAASHWEDPELIAALAEFKFLPYTPWAQAPAWPTPIKRGPPDGVTEVLAEHVKLPPGVTMDQFLAAPRCYFEVFRLQPFNTHCWGMASLPPTIDLTPFDRARFLNDVVNRVLRPIEDVITLVRDQPALTRLYTTMSGPDMTLDPEFTFNPGLPEVSTGHVVEISYLEACAPDVHGPWEATLASGQVVRGNDAVWPVDVVAKLQPANRRILQMSATGPGEIIADNSARLGATAPPGAPPRAGAGGTAGAGVSMGAGGMGGAASARPSAGCRIGAAADGPGIWWAAAAALVALFAMRLRRRHRRG